MNLNIYYGGNKMAAKALDLRPGEIIQEEIRGDYWEKVILFSYSQKRGKIYVTNQRIHVEAGFATVIDIELKDIVNLKKCNVGVFIPTGIDVVLNNGKKYRLSVMKRNERMELIRSLM